VNLGEPSVSVFGVFDGHGACGHHVSAYVRRCAEESQQLSVDFCILNRPCFREIPRILDKELLKAETAQARPNIDSVGVCCPCMYKIHFPHSEIIECRWQSTSSLFLSGSIML
jgi:hypothetical protein